MHTNKVPYKIVNQNRYRIRGSLQCMKDNTRSYWSLKFPQNELKLTLKIEADAKITKIIAQSYKTFILELQLLTKDKKLIEKCIFNFSDSFQTKEKQFQQTDQCYFIAVTLKTPKRHEPEQMGLSNLLLEGVEVKQEEKQFCSKSRNILSYEEAQNMQQRDNRKSLQRIAREEIYKEKLKNRRRLAKEKQAQTVELGYYSRHKERQKRGKIFLQTSEENSRVEKRQLRKKRQDRVADYKTLTGKTKPIKKTAKQKLNSNANSTEYFPFLVHRETNYKLKEYFYNELRPLSNVNQKWLALQKALESTYEIPQQNRLSSVHEETKVKLEQEKAQGQREGPSQI